MGERRKMVGLFGRMAGRQAAWERNLIYKRREDRGSFCRREVEPDT